MSEKKKPAHTIRVGRLTVTIWANDGKDGTWYSVSLSRTYKDATGWKQAATLGRDDLLPAGVLLQQAYLWVAHQAKLEEQPE